ncbi:MAG: DNA repair protein RadC [Dissulfuribacterales bacterium]
MRKEDWQSRGKGHRERLREKYLRNSIAALTDEEIVELLLSFGTPRQDCKLQAREALKRFVSLAGVLEADLKALQEISGIGPKNALAVRFVHDVARKFLKERPVGKNYLHSAQEVVDYLWHALSSLDREVFMCIFLDNQHGVLGIEELFHGTINASAVYAREVIKKALHYGAAALVFAHNHPSGITTPSSADRTITKRLLLAATLMEITVLDHIIVGSRGAYYSFAEHGDMEAIRNEVAGQCAECHP